MFTKRIFSTFHNNNQNESPRLAKPVCLPVTIREKKCRTNFFYSHQNHRLFFSSYFPSHREKLVCCVCVCVCVHIWICRKYPEKIGWLLSTLIVSAGGSHVIWRNHHKSCVLLYFSRWALFLIFCSHFLLPLPFLFYARMSVSEWMSFLLVWSHVCVHMFMFLRGRERLRD